VIHSGECENMGEGFRSISIILFGLNSDGMSNIKIILTHPKTWYASELARSITCLQKSLKLTIPRYE